MIVTFAELVPGDKFVYDFDHRWPVTAVCVSAPVVHSVEKRLFRKPVITLTAKCIELHRIHGACEWNPKLSPDTPVMLDND